MPHSTDLSPITESQILTSYLLPPAPLPTILPYSSSFLPLVPATYRNNPDYASTLKRLYRDLQFQRSITIEQVRDSIERECGVKAATLKVKLARRIALEEGEAKFGNSDGEEGGRRKRRKVNEQETRNDEDTETEGVAVKDEDSIYSSDDELTNPLHLTAQQTMYDHPSGLHPASQALPVLPELLGQQMRFSGGSAFHTKTSLLLAMEEASRCLDREIADLEAECSRMKAGVGETVGGLSDLRYGKRQSDGNDGAEEYSDVLGAVEQFSDVIRAKTAA